jgi:hypothetical protein
MSNAATANDKQTPVAPEPQARSYPQALLKLTVGSVIAAGMVSTALGVAFQTQINLTAIGLLVMLAILAELLQINLYGPDTVSVSVAVMFTAALVGGIPGVACVSAAIALVHYIRRRPLLYKTAFNWATHVLAGLAPALIVGAAGTGLQLQVESLLLMAVPIAIAALVYYVIDTGLIATAIGLTAGMSPLATWRERYQWLAGHYLVLCVMGLFLGLAYITQGPVGIAIFALPVVMMRYSQQQYVERTEDSVRELRRMNEELSHANREVVGASKALQEFNEDLFLTLSKLIDARDPYVGGHASKVSDYAVAIGKELGLSPERLEPLRQGGFLHDIGKIAISEAVLHKPAKLTDEEYEYIKTHAAIGGEFLETCAAASSAFRQHHHERWTERLSR